jgi:protein-disulfide isomerase
MRRQESAMIRLAGLGVAAWLALLGPAVAQPAVVDIDELMTTGALAERTLGNPDAPVVMVEYASMTCPHCGSFHVNTFPALKARYIDTGQVYFVFREYPLDALAFAAVMLARCAPEENFFPIVAGLFEHQGTWAAADVEDPEPGLKDVLEPLGLAPADFETCLANDELFDGIAAVADRARMEFDVSGTPTFFINGQRVVGDISIEQVDEILTSMVP